MTKGARKTGGSRSRTIRNSTLRESQGRSVKATVLIVGEGQQTEPNYFRGLIKEKHISDNFSVKVKKGKGRSSVAVVEEAVKHKREAESRKENFDEVWCVLDVEDQGPDHPNRPAYLKSAIAIAHRNNIILCWSNPSFEVWFLAHFVKQSRSYSDSDAVIRDLNKHWKQHFDKNYQKSEERIYHLISSLTPEAIDNARLVLEKDHSGKANMADCNSATEVYKLVGRLKVCPPNPVV